MKEKLVDLATLGLFSLSAEETINCGLQNKCIEKLMEKDIVYLINELKLDINHPDKNCNTFAHIAAHNKYSQVAIQTLFKNGANLEIKNKNGETVFDILKSLGKKKEVEYLRSIKREDEISTELLNVVIVNGEPIGCLLNIN